MGKSRSIGCSLRLPFVVVKHHQDYENVYVVKV
jgi:hypothetical protein